MDPISVAMGLAQFAPQIIRWVSGSDKAAEAAEHVVGIAQAVTGAGTPGDALSTIVASPDAQLAFRRALLEQESALDKAYLADRQDARRRDVELGKAGMQNTRANWMIVGDVVGLVACLFALTMLPDLPGEVRGIVSTIAGFFGLGLRDAHQFEFGSSRGSHDKQQLLNAR